MTLSRLISQLADTRAEAVTIEEIIGQFGSRAFGAVLFIFAAPNILPMPPGSSAVLGLPLLLVAPQLALGRACPWLPAALRSKTIETSVLRVVDRRAGPWVEAVERLTTRRMAFMFGLVGDALIGLVCTLLAAVLILPLPLGNVLPAAAVAILGLSLVQRDGLLAVVGYLAAAASFAVIVLGGQVFVATARQLFAWVS